MDDNSDEINSNELDDLIMSGRKNALIYFNQIY